MKKYFPLLASVLLILSFPNFSHGYLAWAALVPLLHVIREEKSPKRAFVTGTACGLVFFVITLSWLNFVTSFGWFFLTILEGLFMGLFAVMANAVFRQRYTFLRLVGVAFAWTTVEWLRTEVPVFGFGWNLLAYSQSSYPLVVQFAGVFGAYGLGFVMALINAGIAELLFQIARARNPSEHPETGPKKPILVSLLTLLVTAGLVYSHGVYNLNRNEVPNDEVRIALVQGNIPQDLKWEPNVKYQIIEKYLKLTELTHFNEPDLIVWPEAAYPGYFNRDTASDQVRELVRKIDVPLIVGTPFMDVDWKAFNSALVLDRDGSTAGRYDKINLVPFGEYVPLKLLFGFLQPLAESLGVSDFKAGSEYKVFKLNKPAMPFSVMICFEDIFPSLARNMARAGASLLVVITNDAWFGNTKAAFQHLQASVFRAAENGIPLVRAANTGVSAYISYKGEIIEVLDNENGDALFQTLHQTRAVRLASRMTWFRKGGWLFPYISAIAYAMIMLLWKRKTDQNR